MSQKIRLGKYRGETFVMSVRPEPSSLEETENIEGFSISVFFKKNGETHEIVRIDDSHGFVHMHRLDSERDGKKDLSGMDFWDAMNHLMQNWQRFANYYLENKQM